MNRAEAVSKFNPGTRVKYTGRGYPHLRGVIGKVESITEVGFLRVRYPGRDRLSRINPDHVEIVWHEV